MEGHLFEQDLILFRAPGDFASVFLIWVHKLQVSLVAHHHGLEHELADAAPMLTIQFDTLHQLNIFRIVKVNTSLFHIVFISFEWLQLGAAVLLLLVFASSLLSNQCDCFFLWLFLGRLV